MNAFREHRRADAFGAEVARLSALRNDVARRHPAPVEREHSRHVEAGTRASIAKRIKNMISGSRFNCLATRRAEDSSSASHGIVMVQEKHPTNFNIKVHS
jgi:hypothetical protein